jgi:hypothetical protein
LTCDEGKYAVPRRFRISEGIEITAKKKEKRGKGFVIKVCLGRADVGYLIEIIKIKRHTIKYCSNLDTRDVRWKLSPFRTR